MKIEDYKRWYKNMLRRCNTLGRNEVYTYSLDGEAKEITLEQLYAKTLTDVGFRYRFIRCFTDVNDVETLRERLNAMAETLIFEKTQV